MKIATSALVLLVLGIFAGLAVAGSGGAVAVIRANTSDNSLELQAGSVKVRDGGSELVRITPTSVSIDDITAEPLLGEGVVEHVVFSAELNKEGLFIAEGGKICIGDKCVLGWDHAGFWRPTDTGIEYTEGTC